ncbi:MAG TPA: hypothetical protein VFE53_25120 [Mucilaginibacter sp.]|jgi:hypothetical protein|nr:hypothetical protein [Mucilaginibacter sp.]
MESKEAFVKRRIVASGIIFRLLILFLPIVLYKAPPVPGFRPDQFETLTCILLPLTCLFFTLFIKFIIQNRYQKPGNYLGPAFVSVGYFALLILTLAEAGFITWKAFDDTVIEDNNFYVLIAVFESAWGIYAGFYLSELFGRRGR